MSFQLFVEVITADAYAYEQDERDKSSEEELDNKAFGFGGMPIQTNLRCSRKSSRQPPAG